MQKYLLTAFICFLPCFSYAEFNVFFINGIQNTQARVEASRRRIADILAISRLHQSNAYTFSVSAKYNPVGWYGDESLNSVQSKLQDAAELSLLKVHEESYINDYRSIERPFNRINPIVNSSAIARITPYTELTRRFGNNSVEEAMPADAMIGTKQALDSLYTDFLRNKTQKTIVIAHSEGNLLANLMYAKVGY